ncbi:DUF4431 domain-containing protein [Yersinia aleksiciae]|uniref:DUF4431 domain-containing protein n=1 Tax=Yersinia aleksiciae TaxID=263819 RepID=UPI00067CDB91|nr:DUF4431 domain-containing protein [Yersinia aleksiciae]
MKTYIYKFILSLVLIVPSLLIHAACLNEGDAVKLSGSLKKEVFFGPPSWGEDPKNDKRLTYWILHLDNPLTCVIEANDTQEGWGNDVQLILEKNDYEDYRQFLDKQVSVTGHIFLAQTGYHMTPVLLDDISSISRTNQ